MTKETLYALIMAGGQGTRFWPESTAKKPKQYLKLFGNKSLLESTLLRFDGLIEKSNRYIVTVKQQEEIARKCAGSLVDDNSFIFEPSGRNTAPCILLSLARLLANGASPKDTIAIVPADHVILNAKGLRDVIAEASTIASEQGQIVTIGIPPHFPHTGYGYIQKGSEAQSNVFEVKSFVEKPDIEKAKTYLESGEYLWNAGMFVTSIECLLTEFKNHAPDMTKSFDELIANVNDDEKIQFLYDQIPSDSIDYAVMEKSKNVVVMPARFDWNDLGSWDALEDVIDKTEGNTIASAFNVLNINSQGNIVYCPDKLVALINIDDHIVVSNEEAVLIAPKADAQQVKKIVEQLKSQVSKSF